MTYAKKPDQTFIFPPVRDTPEPEALHKPFSWLVAALRHDSEAQFSSKTKSYCLGIQTCLELVHATDLSSGDYADPAHPPLLSVTARERLMLFAIDACGDLAEQAAADIERRNAKHIKERR
ncbi:hypothetical protein [Paraherbaspirillum soli]|uniref:Uncharacterized protein n=1 Tax=Paraherbaspirillum soli TaxID=631222 RepID=A0ABW0M6F6_9BURK